MLSKLNHQRGSLLPMAAVTAVAIGIMALTVAKLFAQLSRQSLYFKAMSLTYQLADMGMNAATQRLAYDPNPANFDTSPVSVPEFSGEYQNMVAYRDNPVQQIYYIVTSATRTVDGKTYSTRLHSYVRVSNAAEYFAAVKDDLTISHPVDISEGKVYGSTLTFLIDWNPTTESRLKYASYYDACLFGIGNSLQPADWLLSNNGRTAKQEIPITEPLGLNEPEALAMPLLFPELLDTDLAVLREKAGPHTVWNVFTSSHIYPPGYYATPPAEDAYAAAGLHTNNNGHHIYYSTSDIYLQGEVHGQILFVSERNIYITGNLRSSTLFPCNDPVYSSVCPGEGSTQLHESSSSAHQAVLITRGNVYVARDPLVSTTTITTISTRTVDGLILAPLGRVIPEGYPDGDSVLPDGSTMSRHEALSLDFNGSLIVSTLRASPSFYDVYGKNRSGARVYRYMNTLRTNPPPHLPALTEVHYSLEETTGSPGL